MEVIVPPQRDCMRRPFSRSHRAGPVAACAAALLVVACSLPVASAQPRPGVDPSHDVFHRTPQSAPSPSRMEVGEDELTDAADLEHEPGRLFGPLLDGESGITFEPVYYGEVFTNTRGGISTRRATRYEALLDLALTADFEKLNLPVPGKFFLLGQNTHGQGLTEQFVGDAQVVSNIDSFDNIMQVSEYWWEGAFCGENVTVRLGKQDVNSEFILPESAGDFVNSSFGISPTLGVPTYPHTSAAAVVLVQLTDSLVAKVGVWDGVPDGRNWGFSGTGITLTIGELEYDYALCDGLLPGKIDGGVGYVSAGQIGPGLDEPQSWAVHADFEQVLWRENWHDPANEQGLAMFLQYGTSYDQVLIEFPEYFGAGMIYRGLVPGRDEDVVGVAFARSRLSFGGTEVETVTEVFYKAAVRPGFAVQPDLQYITSPSGLYRDSLVVGMRFEAAF